MNIVRMILKEAGGRFENAAGAINSKDNMFRGSSGNAISDKIGGGENNNPVMAQEETQTEETVETPTTETTTPETDTSTTTEETETFSDDLAEEDDLGVVHAAEIVALMPAQADQYRVRGSHVERHNLPAAVRLIALGLGVHAVYHHRKA